jgi:GxxExxY protein
MNESRIVAAEESYRIIGACFEVHNRMGCGFLEDVYQECLAIDFEHQGVPYIQKPIQHLAYRGRQLEQIYKPDFLCFGSIIVEIKAVECLSRKFRAQVLNYLNATGFELGLLINFAGFPKLEHERIVRFER